VFIIHSSPLVTASHGARCLPSHSNTSRDSLYRSHKHISFFRLGVLFDHCWASPYDFTVILHLPYSSFTETFTAPASFFPYVFVFDRNNFTASASSATGDHSAPPFFDPRRRITFFCFPPPLPFGVHSSPPSRPIFFAIFIYPLEFILHLHIDPPFCDHFFFSLADFIHRLHLMHLR